MRRSRRGEKLQKKRIERKKKVERRRMKKGEGRKRRRERMKRREKSWKETKMGVLCSKKKKGFLSGVEERGWKGVGFEVKKRKRRERMKRMKRREKSWKETKTGVISLKKKKKLGHGAEMKEWRG